MSYSCIRKSAPIAQVTNIARFVGAVSDATVTTAGTRTILRNSLRRSFNMADLPERSPGASVATHSAPAQGVSSATVAAPLLAPPAQPMARDDSSEYDGGDSQDEEEMEGAELQAVAVILEEADMETALPLSTVASGGMGRVSRAGTGLSDRGALPAGQSRLRAHSVGWATSLPADPQGLEGLVVPDTADVQALLEAVDRAVVFYVGRVTLRAMPSSNCVKRVFYNQVWGTVL